MIAAWLGFMCILLGTSLTGSNSDQTRSTSGEPFEIPFDFSGHEIVVKVWLGENGPYSMLLDTGTAPSVIDFALAKKIGLTVDPAAGQASGGGTGASDAHQASLPVVKMLGFEARNVAAMTLDFSALSRKFGRPLQGVLGDSLFSGRIVQFDYPHRIARFYAHTVPRPPTGAVVSRLPFTHSDGEIHFKGLFINRHPVLANLDTGSNSTLSLTPTGIKRLHLSQEVARAPSRQSAGFNGSYSSRNGVLRRVRLGQTTKFSLPVTFWTARTGHDQQPWDVNVGNQFMKDYIVTIDYQSNHVTFERPESPLTTHSR